MGFKIFRRSESIYTHSTKEMSYSLPDRVRIETEIPDAINEGTAIDKIKGAGEVVGTMATAIPATIASGYAGLRALANQDVDSDLVARLIRAIQEIHNEKTR
jgi:uncharacterized membrane protein